MEKSLGSAPCVYDQIKASLSGQFSSAEQETKKPTEKMGETARKSFNQYMKT